MTPPTGRKGARRTTDIAPDLLAALERGETQAATLTECLAVDQIRLLQAVFPELSQPARDRATAASGLGILKRMGAIGALLLGELGTPGIARCQDHASDTVRGWACFMIGAQPGLDLPQRLAAIRPLADDAHFGVREWAWLAVRPHLAADLDGSIAQMAVWATAPSERLRRFASESLRPRGVWCAHIAALKKQPERALPILQALNADPSAYVQDSVANWLNDAAKDQPDWVRDLCGQWQRGQPTAATLRICSRALRHLR